MSPDFISTLQPSSRSYVIVHTRTPTPADRERAVCQGTCFIITTTPVRATINPIASTINNRLMIVSTNCNLFMTISFTPSHKPKREWAFYKPFHRKLKFAGYSVQGEDTPFIARLFSWIRQPGLGMLDCLISVMLALRMAFSFSFLRTVNNVPDDCPKILQSPI